MKMTNPSSDEVVDAVSSNQSNDSSNNPSNNSLKDQSNNEIKHGDRVKFDIPTMLLSDPRCSTHLTHYVLDFVDSEDVLFGLSSWNHLHHNHTTLTDSVWWKKRLTREFGTSVTRWSNATLEHWRSKWLPEKADRLSQNMRDNNCEIAAISNDDRERLESLPLWHSAAVHLITRLKTFAHGIMGQSTGSIRLPSAMIYVLLISPPFHYTSEYIIPRWDVGYELWSLSTDIDAYKETKYGVREDIDNDSESFIKLKKDLHWFAKCDNAEATSFLALYTGLCYVVHDQVSQGMGQLEARSLDTREVMFTDPNLWPVVQWEHHQSNLSFEAPNMHQFCLERGVYRYCEKLSMVWDKKAASIDQDDEDEASDDDEDDESSDNDADDSVYEGEIAYEPYETDPHPSFKPSDEIKLDHLYMDRTADDLREAIEQEDC